MRRTEKEMHKVRLKIIELKKIGKDYEEIRQITGASPNTISNILKGFTGRYCIKCGETNPEVLQDHHPDKINQPDKTVTLCANHHDQITRKQARERVKETQETIDLVTMNQEIKLPELIAGQNSPQPVAPPRPLTPQEMKIFNLTALGTCGIGSFCLAKDQKPLEKTILLVTGGLCIWQFFKELKR